MNEEVKTAWLAALRSGEYTQGTGYLHREEEVTPGGETNSQFCCLGVLCDLAAKDGVAMDRGHSTVVMTDHRIIKHHSYGMNMYTLPLPVQRWAGLTDDSPKVTPQLETTRLTELNDEGETFAEIADIIEEYL